MPDPDWSRLAHQAAERHMRAVINAHCDHREGKDVASPAVAAYCGCLPCDIREVLAAAWPIVEDMVAAAQREVWKDIYQAWATA